MEPSSTLKLYVRFLGYTMVLNNNSLSQSNKPIATMTLKRKRSSSAISPFSSASSATISSRDPSNSPCPDVHMLDDSFHLSRPVQRPESAPSYVDSRTRKRFRDNRPEEGVIHGMRSRNFRPLSAHRDFRKQEQSLLISLYQSRDNLPKTFCRCSISPTCCSTNTYPGHPCPPAANSATTVTP